MQSSIMLSNPLRGILPLDREHIKCSLVLYSGHPLSGNLNSLQRSINAFHCHTQDTSLRGVLPLNKRYIKCSSMLYSGQSLFSGMMLPGFVQNST